MSMTLNIWTNGGFSEPVPSFMPMAWVHKIYNILFPTLFCLYLYNKTLENMLRSLSQSF